MADFVVDTNVLLCASAAHETSPFDGADHVSEADLLTVLGWLSAFHADSERFLVLDEMWEIHDEYRHKLTDQDYGLLVIKEKLATARFVPAVSSKPRRAPRHLENRHNFANLKEGRPCRTWDNF